MSDFLLHEAQATAPQPRLKQYLFTETELVSGLKTHCKQRVPHSKRLRAQCASACYKPQPDTITLCHSVFDCLGH